MTLSALIITKDSELQLELLLSQLQEIIPDEIVVCIDSRTVDQTEKVASWYTNKIYHVDFQGKRYVEPILNEAISKCSGDWILRLDDDELMGASFYETRSLIETAGNLAGVLFPTYYCVDRWSFIDAEPWYPDHHLRLFRKDAYKPHRGHIHVPMEVEGEVEYWDDCPIFHMTYLWTSRREREQKSINYGDRYPTLKDKLNALIVYEAYEDLWRDKIRQCVGQPIHPSRWAGCNIREP
jgi:glycosyltransferase involved in cell wall biosynthesis